MNLRHIFRGLLSVILAGVLFAFIPVHSSASQTQYRPYFGLLHSHTGLSGGVGTVEEAFSRASGAEGMDFFAVTEHSHSFDNDLSGTIGSDAAAVSQAWAAGKAAAAAVTSDTFVGIYGYEMSFRDSDGFGHLSTFHTPGFVSRNRDGFDTLGACYEALTQVPEAVSQFNHPGRELGYFENFAHRTDSYDAAVSLLEVSGADGSFSDEFYIRALDKGWHLAPTFSRNPYGPDPGKGRTVILAEALTEQSLYNAMKNRRCYATTDPDLEIRYTLNGAVMGSIVPWADTISLEISLQDATEGSTASAEVVCGGGCVLQTVPLSSEPTTLSLPGKAGYYYLRITQPDGDLAVTAPVWMEEPAQAPEEETTLPPEPEESRPEESLPEESIPEETRSPVEDLDIQFCFGLLHGHTDLSDGKGTVEEAYAAAAGRMDFYAVTDHSNSFDNDLAGEIRTDASSVSESWLRGKAAARDATTSDFVGLFGYEMTWPDDRNLGHIVTFATPGFLSRNREGMENLKDYYEALTTVPGSVSQFCHPGPELGDFENFTHRTAAYDKAMPLLEIGGEEGLDELDSYIKALDAGWHTAPTISHNDHEGNFGSLNTARTAILAREKTEEALYEAMAQRRVYATEDPDLRLYYTLDGHLMGDILPQKDAHRISLLLFDPTDTGTATVEVLCDGGKSICSVPMPESGSLELTVPGGKHYYFLRITQSDGQTAITAPVWTDAYGDIGIDNFCADTQVPVPGQQLTLTLTLSNQETVPFALQSLTLYADGTPCYRLDHPGPVDAGTRRSFLIPFTWNTAGAVTLRAEAAGTIGGFSATVQSELTLHFRPKEMVKGILVDLGHSSHRAEDFDQLNALAQDANMQLNCFTGSVPEEGSILILPPPEQAYAPDFLQQVKIFCARGGTLVVCGESDQQNPQAAEYLNTLLQTAGSTMSIRADTALDPDHNGGKPTQLYPAVFNKDTIFCESLSRFQYYVHRSGATVAPGEGIWLVKGDKTTYASKTEERSPVLLAWEKFPSGGHILAAGSLFLEDESMPALKNRWDTPKANRTFAQILLGITREEFSITPIREVRKGKENILYHIKGYTTSGTSNRHNTFQDTIYLQDDTGGIAITPFREKNIPVGTPMIVAGYLKRQDGNLVFKPVDYDFPDEDAYRYVPETIDHSRAADYKNMGGQLLQVEAKIISLTLTQDGLGVQRLILQDPWGDRIAVHIEDTIFSGAYGTNLLAEKLKIGRTVRAMGLLHVDSNGVPVLRVRNCEEVVWVPPVPRPGDNPYTADNFPLIAGIWAASAGLLVLLLKRRKK